jgi:Sulfocyanin (SoxE) domain
VRSKAATLYGPRRHTAAVLGLLWLGAGTAAGQGSPGPPRVDPSWLGADTATRTVTFHVIAGLTGLNGALNFNGFRDGHLTLTVPRGWHVVLHFTNHDGMLPHSAEVISDVRPLPDGPVPAAFDRAFTVRLGEGLPPQGEDDIRFVADKAGSFLIWCGVPGHGTQGMWIRFRVSSKIRQPTVVATSPAGSQGGSMK